MSQFIMFTEITVVTRWHKDDDVYTERCLVCNRFEDPYDVVRAL